MTPTTNRVKECRHFQGLNNETNSGAFEGKDTLGLESTCPHCFVAMVDRAKVVRFF